jgi:hypothetical protein
VIRTKICITCGRSLPGISFARHWRSKDGLRKECGKCFHVRSSKPHHLLADGHGERCLCVGCDRRRRVLARETLRIRLEWRLLGEAI